MHAKLQSALETRDVEALCSFVRDEASPVLPELTWEVLQTRIDRDLAEFAEQFQETHGIGQMSFLEFRLPGKADEYNVKLEESAVQEYDFLPAEDRIWFGIEKRCNCSVSYGDDSQLQQSSADREDHILERMEEDYPDVDRDLLHAFLQQAGHSMAEHDRAAYGEGVHIVRHPEQMFMLLRTTIEEQGRQDSMLMIRKPNFTYSFDITEGIVSVRLGESGYERAPTEDDLAILRSCLEDLVDSAKRRVFP